MPGFDEYCLDFKNKLKSKDVQVNDVTKFIKGCLSMDGITLSVDKIKLKTLVSTQFQRSSLRPVVRSVMLSKFAADRKKYKEAMKSCVPVFNLLLDDHWEGMKTAGLVKVLLNYCSRLGRLGDAKFNNQRGSEKLVEVFMTVFRRTMTDRNTDAFTSKKLVTLTVVNRLCELYFRLNKSKMCYSLIVNEKNNFLPLHHYSKADLVIYKYYSGLIYLFSSDIEEAAKRLTDAFQKCHKKYTKNKRIILRFLICANLRRRKYPKKALLEKYDLLHLFPLIRSCNLGMPREFDKYLEENQVSLIKDGIFVLLEACRLITLRNLFEKVTIMLKEEYSDRLPFDGFMVILKHLDYEMSEDELECIFCQLIFEGLLLGYVLHRKVRRIIVPKNGNPFPRI